MPRDYGGGKLNRSYGAKAPAEERPTAAATHSKKVDTRARDRQDKDAESRQIPAGPTPLTDSTTKPQTSVSPDSAAHVESTPLPQPARTPATDFEPGETPEMAAARVLATILRPGEVVAWAAKPRPWSDARLSAMWLWALVGVAVLVPTAYYLVLPAVLALPLIAEGFFVAVAVLTSLILALAFAIFPVMLMSMPFGHLSRTRRTWYAVTNQRAIEAWPLDDGVHYREWLASDMPSPRYTRGMSPVHSVVWKDGMLPKPLPKHEQPNHGFYGITDSASGARAVTAIAAMQQLESMAPEGPPVDFPLVIHGVSRAELAIMSTKYREGEYLLWAAKPRGIWHAMSAASGAGMFFGLVIGGMFGSKFMLRTAEELSTGRDFYESMEAMVPPGLVALVAVLLMSLVPYRWWKAKHKVYAVTNQRAMEFTLEHGKAHAVSWKAEGLMQPDVLVERPPYGSVYFYCDLNSALGYNSREGFNGIPDPRSAARALVHMHRTALGEGATWQPWPIRPKTLGGEGD